MHRAFSGLSAFCPRPKSLFEQGFTLVEGLVAASILVVAVMAVAGGFNLAVKSVQETGTRAKALLAIDNDISKIKNLALLYAACAEPTGSFPGTCTSQNSELITPDKPAFFFPVDPSKADTFFTACQSSSPSSHITNNFIQAINNLPQPGSGATRKPAAREAPSDYKNHHVVLEYTARGVSVPRFFKVVPILSAWCP